MTPITAEEMHDMAYAMAKAYQETSNKGQAIKAAQLAEPHINITRDELDLMWLAIDAYVDTKE